MGAGPARDRVSAGRRLIALDGYEVSPEEEALTRTPAQRAALTAQIEGSLLQMHAFWLPLRQAVAERERARRLSPKVGRNEPCPCGSGKKFKKCCGASSERH
ncbi:MAG: SEC-C metal-binding domain-containing protein [Zoogloea sp.]|uniref:SEC-C metal-binding domain-containing protein n=1 Tax=Zoogloea sp. TaxID=49181 RepID=UPI0026373699|nr:SEC-C metal-binding domain-containing protein [Zoogloea sp.]MDD2989497.1 SEC-C metal-binding domain-containing protein [Zoogloea sp.]